ncbi:DUF4407 domain-containing protein [Yeosuana sp. MJ-SS3]|uniref:DUF4407 domain-containing protein n=1 Tax=Gilvirhabdus luticola TaxID=3079858 RepID=A0ABU3U7F9_9FLAO|nr:DUF4407 domain-containing protein [Yeosuana sp. MJ-SS3]MDU8886325.1 DUF4407 domain-containing protein [Yeosuana sp. MJ-SS3]
MKIKRFENNKFFWWFAGEDPYLLSGCTKETKFKFSINGLLVIFIMISSGISISFGVYELLESYLFGLFIGIYFSISIFFLYLFILYTLTKDVLPPKAKSIYGRYSSRALRVVFLIILGLVVSQPIEYWLFSEKVNTILNQEIIRDIENRNLKLNNEYVLKLKDRKSNNYDEELLLLEVESFKKEKEERLNNFIDYQLSRNFFIRKMILMDTSKSTWFIWIFSIIFIVIFIGPVYLKLNISLDTNYYKHMEKIQRKLVLDHHKSFVKSYNEILRNKFGDLNLEWKSDYIDAPFNSTRKDHIILKDDKEFHKWLLDESI